MPMNTRVELTRFRGQLILLEAGRVRQIKRQFLITQLPVKPEQGATQYRLARQTLVARVIDIFQMSIHCHPVLYATMPV